MEREAPHQRAVGNRDKELSLLCVRAYNDWMIDEWAGRAPGRFIPLIIVPLWDMSLAVSEIERTAASQRFTVALRALRDEALVLFPRQHAPGYYDFLMRIWRQSGLAPKLVHESEKLQTIVSLVAMGRGISLMPKCVANLARKGVVCRALRPRAPDTELGLVYDPTNRSNLVQAFVSLAKAILLRSGSPPRPRI